MRFDSNGAGAVNYEPNSLGGPVQDAAYREPPLKISGDADRYDHRAGNDDYGQAGDVFRLMSDDQKRQLMDNIAAAMAGVPEQILRRQVAQFAKADPAYGAGVAERVGLAEEMPSSHEVDAAHVHGRAIKEESIEEFEDVDDESEIWA